MASDISNPVIDSIYEAALAAGATGGKLSGAGGGGFMFFYCPANTRYKIMETLEQFGGKTYSIQFAEKGANSWRTK
jgi:D-glycero-alpha-D-manno-heptose-7-phosphate kinase